jgi:putative inorganic carbon (hco3(-)) transporter
VGVAVAGLVGAEWKPASDSTLGQIYGRLPLLVQGVVYGMPRGGIHPNEVAGVLLLLLAPAAIIGGRLLLGPRSERRLWLGLGLLAAAAMMAAVLVLTQSRSAFIGAAVGLLCGVAGWGSLAIGSARLRRLGALLLLLGLGAGSVVFWSRVVAWTSNSSTGLDSLPSRVEVWDRGLRMLQDFPYTGIGMGQFSIVFHRFYLPVLIPPDSYVPHAHDYFLQLGLDLGVPGAVGILFMLGGFLWTMWRVYRTAASPLLRVIAVGFAAALMGFLIYGLTDAVVIGARAGIVLWILLGLGAALAQVSDGQTAGCAPSRGV